MKSKVSRPDISMRPRPMTKDVNVPKIKKFKDPKTNECMTRRPILRRPSSSRPKHPGNF